MGHVNQDVNQKTYMNASISVVCYKSKTLSNGESPLMLQISKNGKRKYQSLGISINPLHWDFAKSKPKQNCPNGELIQKIILDKVTEFNQQIIELNAYQKEYTPTSLLQKKQQTIITKTVGEFYQELIAHCEATDKRGNRRVYKDSQNSIKTFSKGQMNFLFEDIDVEWLTKYEKWLRSKGNKETTISLFFRTLRSAYNKAIEAKCTSKSNYPFNDYKVSKFDVTTQKRAISKADILKIIKVDLSKESYYMQLSRDIFVFSYLCGGINFTDIANLKADNIIDNRVQYVRQKTSKKINMFLTPEAVAIIQRYRQNRKDDNYLFPILDNKTHITATQKQNRIHKVLGHVDSNLKDVATKAELTGVNLTTYVARHSFATVLKKSGVNIGVISEALGHSDIATTQIYLDSFENSQIDKAMENLL
jgi:site-specific recombinase XerD